MSKKANIMFQFTDLMGVLLFFIGVTVLFLLLGNSKSTITYNINARGPYLEAKANPEMTYLDDRSVLVTILRSPVTKTTNVADEIANLLQNKESRAKEEIELILNSIYGRGRKVCWALWYYNLDAQEPLISVDCKEKIQLFNQETYLPLSPSAQPVKIRLAVLGYAE